MVQPAPDWISFDAEKTEGLDLLGLRAPVQRIGNELFNGVNTVTPKVRYLSVLTWIVWRYSEARLPDSWRSFISFAEAQEAMIVLANRLKSRSILNLVGVTKADKLLDAGKKTLPLQRLAQNVAYNIYVTTSRQLNLTHDENSNFAGLTKERGIDLAKAFDRVIRDTTYAKGLAKDPRLDRVSLKMLEELSDGLFLDRIPREERDILIDAVVPPKPEDDERNRLANYALLLWLTEAKAEVIEEPLGLLDRVRKIAACGLRPSWTPLPGWCAPRLSRLSWRQSTTRSPGYDLHRRPARQAMHFSAHLIAHLLRSSRSVGKTGSLTRSNSARDQPTRMEPSCSGLTARLVSSEQRFA